MNAAHRLVLLACAGSFAQAATLVQFDFDNHAGVGPAFSEANDPAVMSASARMADVSERGLERMAKLAGMLLPGFGC